MQQNRPTNLRRISHFQRIRILKTKILQHNILSSVPETASTCEILSHIMYYYIRGKITHLRLNLKYGTTKSPFLTFRRKASH